MQAVLVASMDCFAGTAILLSLFLVALILAFLLVCTIPLYKVILLARILILIRFTDFEFCKLQGLVVVVVWVI